MDMNTNEKVSTNSVNGSDIDNDSVRVALGRRNSEVSQIRQHAKSSEETINQCGNKGNLKWSGRKQRYLELRCSTFQRTDNGKLVTLERREAHYSGSNAGVGFIVCSKVKKAINEVRPTSNCIISMRLDAKPTPAIFLQVYMPTSTSEEVDVMRVYEEQQSILASTHSRDRLIVMGDFNAKMGKGTQHATCGMFELGELNERGKLLLNWMDETTL